MYSKRWIKPPKATLFIRMEVGLWGIKNKKTPLMRNKSKDSKNGGRGHVENSLLE